MKIALVSDAWLPQVNGVVTTMNNTVRCLKEMGHEITLVTPDRFKTVPCPGYGEIKLSLLPGPQTRRLLEAAAPDMLHIATEGPLGMAARRWCLASNMPFATSYHTRFPEYLRLRAPIPTSLTYRYLRRFHQPACNTLVRTATQKEELSSRGFQHLKIWPGAVNTELFRPMGKDALSLPRPISMYMGRVSIEKNIRAFLDQKLPGSQVVVGGGPDLDSLKREYPKVIFTGARFGEELARTLSAADVFVFPSLTDTLGLVMLEAMACGIPVAAFPVPGPKDVVIDGSTGALSEDLEEAIFRALALDSESCLEFAAEHSWQRSTERFLSYQTVKVDETLSPATSGSVAA